MLVGRWGNAVVVGQLRHAVVIGRLHPLGTGLNRSTDHVLYIVSNLEQGRARELHRSANLGAITHTIVLCITAFFHLLDFRFKNYFCKGYY